MSPRAVVIGVGNEWRGDDGAGIAAARQVRARLARQVVVHELDGEPARLLDAWDGAELAIVIDAVRSGAPAGSVRRIDAASLESAGPAGSSHGGGIGTAYRLGRALGRLPQRLVVLGIEVDETAHGRVLSAAATEGLSRAASEAVALVEVVGAEGRT